jgi:hypothetical protein
VRKIGIIQTSWPDIRVVLYGRDDGLFQFHEERLPSNENGGAIVLHESGVFSEIEAAKAAMIQYAVSAEDDRVADPSSIVILGPGQFEP